MTPTHVVFDIVTTLQLASLELKGYLCCRSKAIQHQFPASMADDGSESLTVEDYFQYKPSLALNIIALVLFFSITAIISVQNVKYKSKFMWVVTFTGCLEVAGYICHLISTTTVNLTGYICYLVFVILAPNFLALANYIAVGKIAQRMELSGRFLNTKTISIGFFVIDLICIGVQGAGDAILSSTLQSSGVASQSGENLVLIGLAIQLFFFATFTFVTVHVWRLQRSSRNPSVDSRVFVCLFATIALITARNIYRVIEIGDGWSGKYNSHEVYFYTLDALPIFLAFCVYSLLHMGRHLPNVLGNGSASIAGPSQPLGTVSHKAHGSSAIQVSTFA